MTTIQNHLVSIVTPAYNSARFIQATIDSVLAQTYTNWELIVVDDCSNDNTSDLVSSIARRDDRIRLIRLEHNQGPAVARNTALKYATGRYIAFLDSDDLWLPNKLELQLSFMNQKGIAFSFTLYRRMSEDGGKWGKLINLPEVLDYAGLLKNTGIAGCLTAIIDRKTTGNFEMEIGYAEDHLLWIQLLKRGFKAYGLQEDLARYRVVNNSRSRNKFKAPFRIWDIYYKKEKLRFHKALWYFCCYAWNAYLKNKQ